LLARLGALAGALAAACFLVAGPASARPACALNDYAYAGLQTRDRVYGVAATITPLSTPEVRYGHVGAWVGVGGPGLGPGATDQWIQVGLSGFPEDGRSRMYYEVARPGAKPRYVEIDAHVAAGERHRVAVFELAKRRSWWRVWVDGRPVGRPIFLPGSHGAWEAQVVAESWNGGTGACNRFSYRFEGISLAGRPGGSWSRLAGAELFSDPGYRAVRSSPATLLTTART
jgi:hypothetical protein